MDLPSEIHYGIYHAAIVGEGIENKIPIRDHDNDRDHDGNYIGEIRRKSPVKEVNKTDASSYFEDNVVFVRILTGVAKERFLVIYLYQLLLLFLYLLYSNIYLYIFRFLKNRGNSSNQRSIHTLSSSYINNTDTNSSSSSMVVTSTTRILDRDSDREPIHDPSDLCIGNSVYSLSALLRICSSCLYYLKGI